MKIIFFGSDDFALTHLEALRHSGHDVLACVTQPDKPKGRGLKLLFSAIKEWAKKNRILLLQPDDLNASHFLNQLKNLNSDLFVVVAYGKILPLKLLFVPYVCAVNVHASLLPKYRGAAPINWAIVNGDQETGVSTIKMNARMDAGDILAQAKIPIDEEDTALTLRSKLAKAGAELLLKTIDSLGKNTHTLTVQNEKEATLAPKLTKELGRIQWTKTAREIHNLIRGLLPWPSAYTFYNGKLLKILAAQIVKTSGGLRKGTPGEIVEITKQGFVAACGQDFLLIKDVHLEASKPMGAEKFVRGHHVDIGMKLGNYSKK